MNRLSNMLKYIGLPLSLLVSSATQAAQISDKDKSQSSYNFFSRIFSRKTTQIDDSKDDEKTDYTIKKPTGLGLLPYDRWSKNRRVVYSSSLSEKETKEIKINKNDDRKKIEKLLLKLLPNKDSFDITYYVVKVCSYFGIDEDNGEKIEGQGTATIIKIEKGIIYLLTCAHNVIKHEDDDEGEQVYCAKNVSFFYQRKEYLCNDYYVHPKYSANSKGKDVAIITSCGGYNIKFPYTFFPNMVSVPKGKYKGYVIGFPGEKEKKGELYGMQGDLEVKEVSVRYYKIDTTKGQSGSAIWAKINGVFKIIGVHTDGQFIKRYNYGSLLDNESKNWKSWLRKKYKGKALPKDLSGEDLSGYDFTGCHFTYTDLTDTNLENAILTNTTCDYQKAFQDHLKENKCYGGDWYKERLPKDLKSIAEVYPKLKNHADKAKLLHIACGISRLPFYTYRELWVKFLYWSCALLKLKKELDSSLVNRFFNGYGSQLVCSFEWYLNYDVENYCWSTDYPQNKVNLEEKKSHAGFGKYLRSFNNGLVKYKCKSKIHYGFNWYKGNIEKNIKGLQKAYPKIERKELQKEACQIGCALSKSYQIRGMLLLFHYLFYQNRLIRFKNSVGIMVKSDIHYNQSHPEFYAPLGWNHGKK